MDGVGLGDLRDLGRESEAAIQRLKWYAEFRISQGLPLKVQIVVSCLFGPQANYANAPVFYGAPQKPNTACMPTNHAADEAPDTPEPDKKSAKATRSLVDIKVSDFFRMSACTESKQAEKPTSFQRTVDGNANIQRTSRMHGVCSPCPLFMMQ